MMSVENDSTMHASYSSIPTDPSLTVLKLSIRQHKGEKKNNKSLSIQALLKLLGVSKPYPKGSRGRGNSRAMLTGTYNPTPLLYLFILQD